jgi:hypothetical protein
MTGEGTLNISRTMSNSEEDYITIEIINDATKAQVEAKVSLEGFAKAVTGRGFIPVTLTCRPPRRKAYVVGDGMDRRHTPETAEKMYRDMLEAESRGTTLTAKQWEAANL